MGDRIGEEELRGALRPGGPWTDVVCLDVADSTNRVAMEMAENGAKHGTVVVADAQTAGRGRLGRLLRLRGQNRVPPPPAMIIA